VAVTEEEGIVVGLCKLEEEVGFGKYAKAAQAGMGEAGPGGPNSEKKFFSNKNWIFQFTKAFEICRRKFRRNFDMRIFPKFF
jgi:hypothetical protein